MNDLVDGNQQSNWIPDNSRCFRVGPITCSLVCLYGNPLNGCQGLRPKTFTLYMGVEKTMCCQKMKHDSNAFCLLCLVLLLCFQDISHGTTKWQTARNNGNVLGDGFGSVA